MSTSQSEVVTSGHSNAQLDVIDRVGAIAGISAYVMWGLLTIYWHGLRSLSAVGLVGQRIVWASLVLAFVLTCTRRWAAIRTVVTTPALLWRVIVASLLLSTNWMMYVIAVTHHNVVETALGYFIAPFVTVAIGVAVFHETLRRAQGIALVVAAIAVVLLTVEAGHIPMVALTLAVTWGFYGMIKRGLPLHPIESLAAETFVLLPIAGVVVLFVERSHHAIHIVASGAQMVMVVGTGAITVVPLLCFGVAARRLPFTVLGPMQYAVPTINFVLGVAFYDEAMGGLRLIGFALVWVALLVFTTDSVRTARRYRATTAAT